MSKFCTMLVNPRSSSYSAAQVLKCQNMIQDAGYYTKLAKINSEENFLCDFYQKANEANIESDLVITYGGDGFFGLYQDAIKDNQQALTSHCPMGTANDMALNLGISKRIIDATFSILNGEIRERDFVTSDNQAFGYVSAFGHITNVPFDIPAHLKKLGSAGYLVGAIPDIVALIAKNFNSYNIRYSKNGEIKEMDCLLGVISNAKGFAGVEVYKDANQDDELFEVLLISPQIINKIPNLLSDFHSALVLNQNTNINLLENYRDEIEMFKTSDLKLEFLNRVPLRPFDNDGDIGPFLEDTNTIEFQTKGKCKLLLPKGR